MSRRRKVPAATPAEAAGVDVKNSRWFVEFTTPHEAHMHGMRKFLATTQSKYQVIEVADSYTYGKCLLLDGKMQSSQADEFIYHEALVHPALITHPRPKRVAIIGGGEGATLREALKHRTVEHAAMIDIDDEVIRLSDELLPEWAAGAFSDRRARVLAADGRKFLQDSPPASYDVVIVDISEPVPGGPSYLLFTKEFYRLVAKRLTPSGVIALQAASTQCVDIAMHAMIVRTLRTVFKHVRPFSIEVPSFDLPWGICVASKRVDPMALSAAAVDRAIAARGLGPLRYYDGQTHEGIFKVPKYLRDAYAATDELIEDRSPLFTAI